MKALGRRINYLWRLFATGSAFALFGIAGLMLAIFFFPFVNLLLPPRARAAIATSTIHRAWQAFIWLLRVSGVMCLTVSGREVLETDRGVIIIANHPSLLDIVILISLVRNTRCIVKQGVWDNIFMRSAVRSADYIPNTDDPDAMIDKCLGSLRQGNNLVIFPEGSRTVPGQPWKFQRGFAHLALRTGAPLRRVEITVDPPTLLKGQKWYDIPPRRVHFDIRVKELIVPETLGLNPVPSRAVRQITAHTAARYRESMHDSRA